MFLEEKKQGEVQRTVLEPSAKNLAYALRHPELWPKGFSWKYLNSNTCAMGLACALWPEYINHSINSTVASVLGINRAVAYEIFVGGNRNWFGLPRTSPHQIARALEKL